MKEPVLLISKDAALAERIRSLLQRLPVELHWQRGYQPIAEWPSTSLVLLDEECLPDDDLLEMEAADDNTESNAVPPVAESPALPILLLVKGGVRRALSIRLGFLDILHQDHRLSHLCWVVQEHLNAICLRRARQRQESEAEADLDPNVFSLRHEINNPLAGILGNAELALASKGRLPQEVRERLERILQLTVQIRELLHGRNLEASVGGIGANSTMMKQPPQAMMMGELTGGSSGSSLAGHI